MESAEPVDMTIMLEALKIADDLERAAGRLKGLGSNTCATERPSLEVQERFHIERFAAVKGIPRSPPPSCWIWKLRWTRSATATQGSMNYSDASPGSTNWRRGVAPRACEEALDEGRQALSAPAQRG